MGNKIILINILFYLFGLKAKQYMIHIPAELTVGLDKQRWLFK